MSHIHISWDINGHLVTSKDGHKVIVDTARAESISSESFIVAPYRHTRGLHGHDWLGERYIIDLRDPRNGWIVRYRSEGNIHSTPPICMMEIDGMERKCLISTASPFSYLRARLTPGRPHDFDEYDESYDSIRDVWHVKGWNLHASAQGFNSMLKVCALNPEKEKLLLMRHPDVDAVIGLDFLRGRVMSVNWPHEYRMHAKPTVEFLNIRPDFTKKLRPAGSGAYCEHGLVLKRMNRRPLVSSEPPASTDATFLDIARAHILLLKFHGGLPDRLKVRFVGLIEFSEIYELVSILLGVRPEDSPLLPDEMVLRKAGREVDDPKTLLELGYKLLDCALLTTPMLNDACLRERLAVKLREKLRLIDLVYSNKE